MKVDFKQKLIKDTFYTVTPLNHLLRFFGLSCVYREGNEIKFSCAKTKSVVYVFIFGFINFFFLQEKMRVFGRGKSNNNNISFTEAVQMCYLIGYFQYLNDLYYVIKYGRDSLLTYYKTFDLIDHILGMTNYKQIRRIVTKTFICSIGVFIFSSVFDYLSWSGGGWVAPTLYTLDYFYFFLNMLTILDGMGATLQLEFRLKKMAEILQGYYSSSDPINVIHTESTIAKLEPLSSLKSISQEQIVKISGLSRCYLLLLEQTKYLNKMFGCRVIGMCTNILVNTITSLNTAIRLAVGTMVTPDGSIIMPTIGTVIRLLNWAIMGFIMIYRCEKDYAQCNKIIEVIDSILINENTSKELKTTLVDLRNLVITRPIKFNAAGFFTIDYTLLVSMTSVAATYTIIMLQNMH